MAGLIVNNFEESYTYRLLFLNTLSVPSIVKIALYNRYNYD